MNMIHRVNVEFPDVYILVRLYRNFSRPWDEFHQSIQPAISSIQENIDNYRGNIVVLLNDDSWTDDEAALKEHQSNVADAFMQFGQLDAGKISALKPWIIDSYYDSLDSRICSSCIEYLNETEHRRFSEDYVYTRRRNSRLIFVRTGGKGSSYAMWALRELFLHCAKDNDIAITLDQDDRLGAKAVHRIARKMRRTRADVCVSQFATKDTEISSGIHGTGVVHNRTVRSLAACMINSNYRDYARVMNRIDTLCWTKSFTRRTLSTYHDDLFSFLKTYRRSPEEYFTRYRAYEDFIDYYPLMKRCTCVCGVAYKAHIYNKNTDAITTNPSLRDFKYDRREHLMSLIMLSQYFNDSLVPGYKPMLRDFVCGKIRKIENILNGYRQKTVQGIDSELSCTYPGYFLSTLCDIDSPRDCYSSNDSIPSIGNKHMPDYDEICLCRLFELPVDFSCVRSPSVKENLEQAVLRSSQKRYLTLRQWLKDKYIRFGAFWGKYHRRLARITFDNTIESRRDYRKTPRQIEAKKLLFTTAIPIVISIMLVYYYRGLLSASTFGGPSEAVTNLLAVITTIIVFLLGRYFFLRAGASEEKSAKKLYFSEFEDLLRHINANLKVMVQLQYELGLDNGECSVASVHLKNLQWPEKSCLFSDDVAKIIDKDKIDDFARLKVNIRNINNSAAYLSSYAESDGCRKDKLIELMDWEIARNFGYYICFSYMKANNFQFPDPETILVYSMNHSIQKAFEQIYLNIPKDKRHKDVVDYLNMYFNDREFKRTVVLLPKSE